MKLIMENWKRYLKEEISQEEQKIKTLMGEFADDDEFINQAIELAIIKGIDYFKYLPWRYKKAKLKDKSATAEELHQIFDSIPGLSASNRGSHWMVYELSIHPNSDAALLTKIKDLGIPAASIRGIVTRRLNDLGAVQ